MNTEDQILSPKLREEFRQEFDSSMADVTELLLKTLSVLAAMRLHPDGTPLSVALKDSEKYLRNDPHSLAAELCSTLVAPLFPDAVLEPGTIRNKKDGSFGITVVVREKAKVDATQTELPLDIGGN